MIIAIASGKGGTGKTTVATSLAVCLDAPVQLLDCDVEEPNAHIFLKPENPRIRRVTTMVPQVDAERCNLCRKCRRICQFNAIMILGDTVVTFPELCHSCYGCLMVCPEAAISESFREIGELVSGSAGNVELVYGRMRVGEAMSPPLIQEVKAQHNSDLPAIIDAPPGTSCPVVTALTGVDFVVLVTEPTPFGFNDLVLAVEAVRSMQLPFGIVINRCDSGDRQVVRYAEKEKIPILMEIPDQRKIAENYSRGVVPVNADDGLRTAFRDLYKDILTRI